MPRAGKELTEWEEKMLRKYIGIYSRPGLCRFFGIGLRELEAAQSRLGLRIDGHGHDYADR